MTRIYSPHDAGIRTAEKETIDQHQLSTMTDVGVFLDSIVGPLLVYLLIRHKRIDEPFAAVVFDQIVAAQRFDKPAMEGRRAQTGS